MFTNCIRFWRSNKDAFGRGEAQLAGRCPPYRTAIETPRDGTDTAWPHEFICRWGAKLNSSQINLHREVTGSYGLLRAFWRPVRKNATWVARPVSPHRALWMMADTPSGLKAQNRSDLRSLPKCGILFSKSTSLNSTQKISVKRYETFEKYRKFKIISPTPKFI